MIYVTGDVHGMDDFGKMRDPVLRDLGRDDYLIVCGDFGVVFDPRDTERMVGLYSEFPFTILFCDGNHENFDVLNSYPVEEWHGGRVHRVSPNIIHLMRGQVFDIDGRRFFVFGGARSRDRDRRVEGLNWWPEEEPTEDEFQEGLRSIQACGGAVDYVVTHDCPLGVLQDVRRLLNGRRGAIEPYRLNEMLQEYAGRLSFRRWFFGHWHMDWSFDEYTCCYNGFVRIE